MTTWSAAGPRGHWGGNSRRAWLDATVRSHEHNHLPCPSPAPLAAARPVPGHCHRCSPGAVEQPVGGRTEDAVDTLADARRHRAAGAGAGRAPKADRRHLRCAARW
ncbi:hypothetical protein G6F32_015990 [Rhizopus arrhizus]|nr:hypothetical protein G6F32_015990 [Rhizopus arrhizus]